MRTWLFLCVALAAAPHLAAQDPLALPARPFPAADKPATVTAVLAAKREAKQRAIDAMLPIQPTRTVSFETATIHTNQLDLAPDGKTFIFALLGDLYTLPVN